VDIKLRRAFVICWVMLASAGISGQTQDTGSDPLSGHWGREDVTFLELKFDGKNAVTGTAIWRSGPGDEGQRAPIATGTFEPKTGALKLEGDAKDPGDGSAAKFLIQGKLDAGTLAGTFEFGSRSGEFSFRRQPRPSSGRE
jgi:hypothetical protein